MKKVDDNLFNDFVTNNLPLSIMNEVEESLIQSGEASASLLASIAYYETNRDLADELIGIDDYLFPAEDRNSKSLSSIWVEQINKKTIEMKKNYSLSPGMTAVAAMSSQKLVHLYRTQGFNFFKTANVACGVDTNTSNIEGLQNIQESSGSIGFAQADTVHGLPSLDVEFDPNTYQYYPDTCAFQSQALILREYGFNVTQEDLLNIAREQGWYVDGHGTPIDKVGKMIEHFGVDTSYTEGNNIFNLTNELAQGHRVLVTVDSGELWTPGMAEKLEDALLGQRPDHALLVVGVDTSDPDDVKVIVTDPGNGNKQFAYSQHQFMDAWKDSNCFMASTDESPEEFLSHTNLPPMDYFADIPYCAISRLAESGIDVLDDDYHNFFGELISNPEEYESLMNEYQDIFDNDMDESQDDDSE